MKITVLEPCGYCSGVERAMQLAIKTKEENASKSVVILGMLVHNNDSLKTLEKHGIKTIYKENCSLEQLIEYINEPSIVILTAHGHKKVIEEMLVKKGHTFVDATCPFVLNSLKEIKKSADENKDILYIGVENHPEAIASLSISKKVKFVDVKNPVLPTLNNDSPIVIAQTTLSRFEVEYIFNIIKNEYKNAMFLDGICNASTKRQKSLMSLGNDVDLIYVVGGANSNNSKTLYNLAKKLYKDKMVKLIQNADDINKKDLLGLSHVVISSGASTPKEIISEIKDKLSN